MTDKPEAAPDAEWQLEMWFDESLAVISTKTRDSLRAYFLVGEEKHASELLEYTCRLYSQGETVTLVDVDLSHPDLTPENLYETLGLRSNNYHKAKLARRRKCVLFRNLDQATPALRQAMIGLSKNRRCGPMYFPSNWMAYIHMATERSIVELLPTKLLLDACWIAVTKGTDVGSIDAQEVLGVYIEKTEDAGRHYGPRGTDKKKDTVQEEDRDYYNTSILDRNLPFMIASYREGPEEEDDNILRESQ